MANIAKRADGRWRARYRDATGKEHARHSDRKVDAQRYLDNVTASVVRGDYVDPARSRMTVGEWAQPWIAGRAHLKPKTLSSYRSLLRTRVAPRWGEVPLKAITHADAVAWVAGMRADGLSASRTRQAYHLLTSMLDDAVKDNRYPATRSPVSTSLGCPPRSAAT